MGTGLVERNMASTALAIKPYVGAGGIAFGMTRDQVGTILGDPIRVGKNILGERDELREGIRVTYSTDGGVVEIGIFPPAEAVYEGINLFDTVDPISVLLRDDPEPSESVGFLVFLRLGVTVTGIHDHDDAQRAVTVFVRGRWDRMRENLRPWR